MKVHTTKLQISTTREYDVIDITTDVEKALLESNVIDGYALVYSMHTTCSVVVNEKETGLLADLNATMQRLVPVLDTYLHDDFNIRTENMHEGETKNAHAHLRQILGGGTSEYVPVAEGSLLLGKWQRIMFIEFDRPREREVLIQICGA